MKNLLLAMTLLLGAAWAGAQMYPSQQQTNPQPGANTQASANAPTTIEGCLSGGNGSYTLTAKDGTVYQLTGNTAKLDKHIGHEVRITGTTGSAASSTSGTGSQTGTATNEGANTAQQTLDVTSVKHVSTTCKTGK